MLRIADLRPVAAWVVVIAVLLIAGLLGAVVDSRFSLSVMTTTASLVYLGWPFAVGMTLTTGLADWKRSRLLSSVAVPYLLLFHAIGGFLVTAGNRPWSAHEGWLLTVAWLVALAATAQVIWFGASALVAAENGSRVPPNRCFGTALEFLLLPLGVPFLQRRLRATQRASRIETQ